MGLVLNLRKTLSNTVSKILAEALSAFIRRRAKLTLKKPDNSSETMSSPSPLTMGHHSSTIATSSQGTTEKTTMEKTTEEIVDGIRDWALERVAEIHADVALHQHDQGQLDDAFAIYKEFAEWIDPEGEEIDLLCLE